MKKNTVHMPRVNSFWYQNTKPNISHQIYRAVIVDANFMNWKVLYNYHSKCHASDINEIPLKITCDSSHMRKWYAKVHGVFVHTSSNFVWFCIEFVAFNAFDGITSATILPIDAIDRQMFYTVLFVIADDASVEF